MFSFLTHYLSLVFSRPSLTILERAQLPAHVDQELLQLCLDSGLSNENLGVVDGLLARQAEIGGGRRNHLRRTANADLEREEKERGRRKRGGGRISRRRGG